MYLFPQTLASGIPQGSILGPILFLIYINDLSLFIKNSNLDLYADDSTLYTSGAKSLEVQTNLQSSLNSILDWCTYNNMVVNPTKTKCMLIGPKNKFIYCKLDLRINNVPIENVESHKILGVHVDKHLSWAVHIDKTCTKMNSKIALLKRISIYLTFEMKQLFYSSYILPCFDYCCPFGEEIVYKIYLELACCRKSCPHYTWGFNKDTFKRSFYSTKMVKLW